MRKLEKEDGPANVGEESRNSPDDEVGRSWIGEMCGGSQVVEVDGWEGNAVDSKDKQFAAIRVVDPETKHNEAEDADDAETDGRDKVALALRNDHGAPMITQGRSAASAQFE